MGAGPHGYVLKDTPQDRLLEAIQVANAKGRYFPADTRFRISDNTARNHVNSIVEKLEVSDRAEAATTATRQGLMTD